MPNDAMYMPMMPNDAQYMHMLPCCEATAVTMLSDILVGGNVQQMAYTYIFVR